MTAYWIAHVTVTDPQAYAGYQALAPAVFARHGGKFLARGGAGEVLEGPQHSRHVIIAFPSLAAAHDCYHSPEYQAAKARRDGACRAEVAIVDGLPADDLSAPETTPQSTAQSAPQSAPQDMFEKGLDIRKAVLGSAYVDRALDAADDFNRDFQRLVTRYCWGESWGREGPLSRRDRSLMNLVMLGALNRGEEFKLHVKGAVTNGCSRAEIRDALIHLAIYAGIPAGVEAFRLARQALAEVARQAVHDHPGSGDGP